MNSTKIGKRNGLFLMIDPNPYQVKSTNNIEVERNSPDDFKVYIHTLAQHTAFGPGAYTLNNLKSMTGTESFENLPDSQKECQVHNREECQTEKFLEHVSLSCNCNLWTLMPANNQSKVQLLKCHVCDSFQHAPVICGPKSESCVARQVLKDDSCLVPCAGLYADVSDNSLERKMSEGWFHNLLIKMSLTLRFSFIKWWNKTKWLPDWLWTDRKEKI